MLESYKSMVYDLKKKVLFNFILQFFLYMYI